MLFTLIMITSAATITANALLIHHMHTTCRTTTRTGATCENTHKEAPTN